MTCQRPTPPDRALPATDTGAAMAHRRYTPEQKAEALALYATDGPTAVADQLGIPKATVVGWARSNGVRTVRNERTAEAVEAARVDRELTRERLRDAMLAKALDLIGRMDEKHIDFRGKDCTEVEFPKPSPSGCQAYATAAAILLDKVRLELGEVTGRTEHRTTDHLDREIENLLGKLPEPAS
jgi:transposase-like protein